MIKERRKHKRTKKQLPIKIADTTFDVISETVDISPSGTYCRVTRLLPLMSKVELVLLLPSKNNGKHAKKVKCKGVVVRAEPIILKETDKAHYNIAIFFTEISEKDQKVITSYVDSGAIDEAEIQINS